MKRFAWKLRSCASSRRQLAFDSFGHFDILTCQVLALEAIWAAVDSFGDSFIFS
jgi:hypothetical protein